MWLCCEYHHHLLATSAVSTTTPSRGANVITALLLIKAGPDKIEHYNEFLLKDPSHLLNMIYEVCIHYPTFVLDHFVCLRDIHTYILSNQGTRKFLLIPPLISCTSNVNVVHTSKHGNMIDITGTVLLNNFCHSLIKHVFNSQLLLSYCNAQKLV